MSEDFSTIYESLDRDTKNLVSDLALTKPARWINLDIFLGLLNHQRSKLEEEMTRETLVELLRKLVVMEIVIEHNDQFEIVNGGFIAWVLTTINRWPFENNWSKIAGDDLENL